MIFINEMKILMKSLSSYLKVYKNHIDDMIDTQLNVPDPSKQIPNQSSQLQSTCLPQYVKQ
jgi:hypothetical protein